MAEIKEGNIFLSIDFGNLELETQKEILKELIETVPDKHIAEVIIGSGTQELSDNLEDWVNETVNEDEDGSEEVQSEEIRDTSGGDSSQS